MVVVAVILILILIVCVTAVILILIVIVCVTKSENHGCKRLRCAWVFGDAASQRCFHARVRTYTS